MSLSSTLPPNELALDEERNRFMTPRSDLRLSRLFERAERDSSLLVLLEVGRGERRPFEVVGRASPSCVDFLLVHDTERRIQEGDSKSFDVCESGPVDITSSDMNVALLRELWVIEFKSCGMSLSRVAECNSVLSESSKVSQRLPCPFVLYPILIALRAAPPERLCTVLYGSMSGGRLHLERTGGEGPQRDVRGCAVSPNQAVRFRWRANSFSNLYQNVARNASRLIADKFRPPSIWCDSTVGFSRMD